MAKAIASIEKEVEVIVRPYKYIRSKAQNDYYWGVIVKEIADHTGYTDDETHEILKSLFLSKKVILQTNDGIKTHRITQTTTKLKTGDMEAYLSKCRQWASLSLGVYLPESNERGNYGQNA